MRASPSTPASDLAALVDVEARLDRAIAEARVAAAAVVAAARAHAVEQAALIDAQIERERERISTELAAETAAEIEAIAGAARAQIARFEAVHGDVANEVARALTAKLAELALVEVTP